MKVKRLYRWQARISRIFCLCQQRLAGWPYWPESAAGVLWALFIPVWKSRTQQGRRSPLQLGQPRVSGRTVFQDVLHENKLCLGTLIPSCQGAGRRQELGPVLVSKVSQSVWRERLLQAAPAHAVWGIFGVQEGAFWPGHQRYCCWPYL